MHHRSYERLGAELPADLIALCAACHRGAHPPGRTELHRTVRRTLARLEQLGPDGELDTDALLAREGGSKKALLARLRTLEGAGLVTRRGGGIKGDPRRWRATGPS